MLAMVSLRAEELDINDCVTTFGTNVPRIEQNLVFLLVPDTVVAANAADSMSLFGGAAVQAEQGRGRLTDLARTVLAMRKLQSQPDAHGINPRRLDDENVKQRFAERQKALETAVTQSYKFLWFPSSTGQIVRKEIRTAGGESGAAVFEQIRKILLDEGELITAEQTGQSHLKSLSKLFFTSQRDTVSLKTLRENFCRVRSWPILDSSDILDTIIRSGVTRGTWCLFEMGSQDNTKPEELYSQETGELPLNLDLMRDYSIVTMEGARKRGWLAAAGPDLSRLKSWVADTIGEKQEVEVAALVDAVIEEHGEISRNKVVDTVGDLIKSQKAMAFSGKAGQQEKPSQLYSGVTAALYIPKEEDVIITPATAATKGWVTAEKESFRLSGSHGANKFLPLLRRIGSLYNRGATSKLNLLDVTDLKLPKGGRLRLSLEEATPETMKDLAELFEILDGITEKDGNTDVFLEIDEINDTCAFLKELQK